MANPDHLDILRQGTEVWNRWRRQYPKRLPDLSAAQINGAQLQRLNLAGANLRGVQLRGTDLRSADLRRADLFAADLCEANLNHACLEGANLFGVNFWKTRLVGARLAQANLYGANLRRADLSQASLVAASLKRGTLEGARFAGARIEEVDVSGADLTPDDLKAATRGRVIAFTEARLFQAPSPGSPWSALCAASRAFMGACGFGFVADVENEAARLVQVAKFWSDAPRSLADLETLYDHALQALQNAMFDYRDPRLPGTVSAAAGSLLAAMSQVESGIVRLGELVIARLMTLGKTHLSVTPISPALAHALALDPALLGDAHQALTFLSQGRHALEPSRPRSR